MRGSIEPFASVPDMQTNVPRRRDKTHDRHRGTTVLDDVLQCLLCDAERCFFALIESEKSAGYGDRNRLTGSSKLVMARDFW